MGDLDNLLIWRHFPLLIFDVSLDEVGVSLTRVTSKAIFIAMPTLRPIVLLTRILFAALLGVVLAPSLASAHGAFGMAGTHLQQRIDTRATHDSVDTSTVEVSVAAGQLEVLAGSCDGHQSAGDPFDDGCCNVACHAAVAAATVDDLCACELGESHLAGLADMLVGRPSGGTERPPKRG